MNRRGFFWFDAGVLGVGQRGCVKINLSACRGTYRGGRLPSPSIQNDSGLPQGPAERFRGILSLL